MFDPNYLNLPGNGNAGSQRVSQAVYGYNGGHTNTQLGAIPLTAPTHGALGITPNEYSELFTMPGNDPNTVEAHNMPFLGQGREQFNMMRDGINNPGLEGFSNVIFGEIDDQQALADQQHATLTGVSDDFRSFIQRGEDASNALIDSADQYDVTGQQFLDDVREAAGADTEFVKNRVMRNEALFEDDSAAQVQASRLANQRQFEAQKSRIMSDPSMPMAMKRGRIAEMEYERNLALGSALATAGVDYNRARANLSTAGTQIIAQAQGQERQAEIAAGQIQQAYGQIASATRIAGTEAMASFASMMPSYFQMVAANPPPFISRLAGMMRLAQIAMASASSEQGAAAVAAVGAPTGPGGSGFNTPTEYQSVVGGEEAA